MKPKNTKSFTWQGFAKATNSSKTMGHIIYTGNFVMEWVLPNSLKIDSYSKLRYRLAVYVKSHKNRLPHTIVVNKRQYNEYSSLVVNESGTLTYQGIPVVINEKS